MKIILATISLMFSLSSFAQTAVPTRATDVPIPSTDKDVKAKPQAVAPSTTEQQQQAAPGQGPAGEENPFAIGPYDQKGQFIYFDRLQLEKEEARNEPTGASQGASQ